MNTAAQTDVKEEVKTIDPFYEDGKARRVVAIQKAKDKFVDINHHIKLLDWATEESFAIQLINNNDFIRNTAEKNPQSLYRAMTNVAAVGLTLNPALGYAYLVPRDGKICLDISYKGLCKIATDSGAVRFVQARLVMDYETFKLNKINELPTHESTRENSFIGEKGKVVGVYCVAKTSDNDFLTEPMSADECNEIMNRSAAVKSGKHNPWLTDWNEMAKKTVVKRASKMWPKSERTERLDNAINILNEHEGIDFEREHTPKEPVVVITEEQEVNLIAALEDKGVKLEKVLKYYKINKLSDLPQDKLDDCFKLIENTKPAEKK